MRIRRLHEKKVYENMPSQFCAPVWNDKSSIDNFCRTSSSSIWHCWRSTIRSRHYRDIEFESSRTSRTSRTHLNFCWGVSRIGYLNESNELWGFRRRASDADERSLIEFAYNGGIWQTNIGFPLSYVNLCHSARNEPLATLSCWVCVMLSVADIHRYFSYSGYRYSSYPTPDIEIERLASFA